jgi:hypothetical protein
VLETGDQWRGIGERKDGSKAADGAPVGEDGVAQRALDQVLVRSDLHGGDICAIELRLEPGIRNLGGCGAASDELEGESQQEDRQQPNEVPPEPCLWLSGLHWSSCLGAHRALCPLNISRPYRRGRDAAVVLHHRGHRSRIR